MRGSYTVVVKNARVQFKLHLNRNLTILRGNSATGKTTVIEMIAEYAANGASSGVTITSDKPCVVLTDGFWEDQLARTSDSFVFVDEANAFTKTEAFARRAKDSDNYYVLASREDLPMLPYSVTEICRIGNTTARRKGSRKFFSQTRPIYSNLPLVTTAGARPDLVVVEDSNAGYQFFSALCSKSNIPCITAAGKGNMLRVLRARGESDVVAIADGAAFGPHVQMVYDLARLRGYTLFLPESFEWLILESGLIKDSEIPKVLADPASFVDSRDYFSWEQFFTSFLVRKSQGGYLRFNKSQLNDAYLQPHEMGAIAAVLSSLGLGDLVP